MELLKDHQSKVSTYQNISACDTRSSSDCIPDNRADITIVGETGSMTDHGGMGPGPMNGAQREIRWLIPAGLAGQTYEVTGSELKTYYSALAACRKMGGTMACPRNELQQQIIRY